MCAKRCLNEQNGAKGAKNWSNRVKVEKSWCGGGEMCTWWSTKKKEERDFGGAVQCDLGLWDTNHTEIAQSVGEIQNHSFQECLMIMRIRL